MRSVFPVVLLCSFVVPTVTAGTEAEPEIKDPAGDVTYSPLYVGSQDHDYIDLQSFWIDYDSANDSMLAHLVLGDTTWLESPGSDWAGGCSIYGDVRLVDDMRGRLWFRWSNRAQASRVAVNVSWQDYVDQVGGDLQEIPSKSQVEFASPGTILFTVTREVVLRYGDSIQAFDARCSESFRPGGAAPVTAIFNDDQAISDRSLSFNWTRPGGPASDDSLPPGSRRPPNSDDSRESTPVPAWTTLFAIATVLGIFRRNHP